MTTPDQTSTLIETRVECETWQCIDCEAIAQRCYAAVCAAEPEARALVSVLFTSDDTMRALNSAYRDKPAPTNVLSFPAGDMVIAEGSFLGDIALGAQTCAREAREKAVALEDHAAHLLIHGLLHLLGYDHEIPRDAELMEARERDILKGIGIADPYGDPLET